jgi:DNA polymerase-3 subunit epsilon
MNAMKAKQRFIVAVIILGLLMTGPFVVTSLLVWLDMREAERNMLTQLLLSRLPVGSMMTIFGFAIGVMVLHKLFKQYVEGLLRMAETLRLMLGANRNFRVAAGRPARGSATGPGGQRSRAAARCADGRCGRPDFAEAKASVEEEKNRLAALMSELAQAVVVCNLDGRILLYNNRARLQFKALAQGPTSVSGGALIGLGRSIFSILEKNQVQHAQEVIRQRLAEWQDGAVELHHDNLRGGQLLRVQMVPVLALRAEGGEAMSGYVLTVENITRSIEQEARRDQVLHSLTEGSRARRSAIFRAAVTNLIDYPDMEGGVARTLPEVSSDDEAVGHEPATRPDHGRVLRFDENALAAGGYSRDRHHCRSPAAHR